MHIALLNTATPFVRGGAEILIDDISEQLRKRGHSATIFRVPFPADFEGPLISLYAAVRMLRFDGYDRVIAFKFPAYCANHPNVVVWLFHQFRQIYDLWETEGGFRSSPQTEALRKVIGGIDGNELPKARHVYAISGEVAKRLKKHNSIVCEVLPTLSTLKNPERYYQGETGDYVFCPSRVTRLKRQHLAVEAMRYTKTDVRLVLAGVCEEPGYEEELREIIKKYNLKDKVSYRNKWITDEDKIKWMAGCLCAIYIPYIEDTAGYVTLEAVRSQKPFITCTDSGGTLDIVKHGESGYVVAPDPRKIAKVMDALYIDRKHARELGEAAWRNFQSCGYNLTWDDLVEKILD